MKQNEKKLKKDDIYLKQEKPCWSNNSKIYSIYNKK